MFTMKRLTLAASAAALALMLAACSQEEKPAEPAPTPAAPAEPAPAPAEPAPAPAEPAPPHPQNPHLLRPNRRPPRPSPLRLLPRRELRAPHPVGSLKIGTEGAYPPFNNLDCRRQARRLRHRHRQCALRGDEGDLRVRHAGLGRHHPGAAGRQVRRDHRIDVDHAGTRRRRSTSPNKYYNTPPAVVAPKDSTIKGVTKEDLAGKTMGVATSTTHYNYAEKTYTDSTLKGYPSSKEFLLDLANGRLDAASDDISVLEAWLASPDGACCKLVGAITPVVEIHGPGAGIAVRKGETDLVNKFNTAIDAIRASGKYKEINDKYFKYDVYGGES